MSYKTQCFSNLLNSQNANTFAVTMCKAPALKPQDVLVVCKLWCLGSSEWTYSKLADSLEISVSEVHEAIKRCRLAQLVTSAREVPMVSKKHFFDLLSVAVPRIFFAARGGIESGSPTSVHAPSLMATFDGIKSIPLKDIFPTVWPHPDGTMRGETLMPIYPTAAEAARKDDALYELLALVDVIRIGDVKYKKKATDLLEKKIFGKTMD